MTIIPIELSVQGVNKAIKALERYRREIVPKLDEVCKRLAEIGLAEAQKIVSGIRAAEGNSVDDLGIAPMRNGYKLTMSGKDVYFIEFGTGDGVDAHFDAKVPVKWGSWSEGHQRKLVDYGFWFYGGNQFTGTQAYSPMFYASKAIRENAKRVVEEIFG